MRATVKDVAQRAGVSPKTVSNVINGTVFVREETRERVLAALSELDYVPNLSARGLRNGRSGVIALALPDLATAYSAETAAAFVELAHERGWGVQIEQTGAEPQREAELVSRARAQLVDGLVLNPVRLAESAIVTGVQLPPVVLIGEVQQDLVDSVSVDSLGAARAMTSALIARGHRRILALGTAGRHFDIASARLRTEGYRQALAEAGLPNDPALEAEVVHWTPANAAAVFRDHVERHGTPDAVFAFTDSMALGVLHELWRLGLTAPHDMAVAGFDDVVESRFAAPPLSTVGFDKRTFAATALELLERRILDRDAPRAARIVPHRLEFRASTGD